MVEGFTLIIKQNMELCCRPRVVVAQPRSLGAATAYSELTPGPENDKFHSRRQRAEHEQIVVQQKVQHTFFVDLNVNWYVNLG